MTLSSYVSLSVKIDWNGDGDFVDANEDVSGYVLSGLSTKRGRQQSSDEFGAGTGSFELRNSDGLFSPFNPSSALYPNVLPGRDVKVEATYNAVTYPVFRGRCTPEGQSRRGMSVSFGMIDGFEALRLGKTSTALLENVRVDEVVTAILDDIGWPAGDRDLDTALATLPVFPNHNRSTLEALLLAGKQELAGANLFLSRAGKVALFNRTHRSAAALYATLAGTFDDLDPRLRQEDLVDSVRASYARYTVETANSVLFSLSTPLLVQPGTTTIEFEINASGVVGGKSYVSPLVSATDFTANTAADGTGTDKTAQCAITIPASDSGGGSLAIVNSDSVAFYVRLLHVRGLAVKPGGETNAVTATVAAPIITGQQYSQDFEFNQSATDVTGWVTYTRGARGYVRPRPVVDITPDTDALMATVLGAEIGSKIVLQDTGANWLTLINDTFFVEGIDLQFLGPGEVRAKWYLLDRDLSSGSFFRISGAAGGGQDRSLIATAAATSGYDRLGF